MLNHKSESDLNYFGYFPEEENEVIFCGSFEIMVSKKSQPFKNLTITEMEITRFN